MLMMMMMLKPPDTMRLRVLYYIFLTPDFVLFTLTLSLKRSRKVISHASKDSLPSFWWLSRRRWESERWGRKSRQMWRRKWKRDKTLKKDY
jgi:hypothetical protein